MSQSWSVVVFCYNEQKTVAKVIEKVNETLSKMQVSAFEIIVVDDGSTDGSLQEILETAKKLPAVIVVDHKTNKGIGQALISGYNQAQYQNISAVPADSQFDVTELMKHAEVPENSFVSFYRKENTTYGFMRNALSMVNKYINKWFIGLDLRDVNWVKIYKNTDLAKLQLELTSSLIESEICAKLVKMGKTVIEEQSVYLPRDHGKSKGASFKIVALAILDTLVLFRVLRRFKIEKN